MQDRRHCNAALSAVYIVAADIIRFASYPHTARAHDSNMKMKIIVKFLEE